MDQSHAYDSVVDMSYTTDFDVFSLRVRDVTIEDVSLTALDDKGDDYIAFDNNEPGRLVGATFHGRNAVALDVMTRLFDDDFGPTAQAMRDGARQYGQETMRVEITVPYTNSRRLARIALHAASKTAPAAIKALAARVA